MHGEVQPHGAVLVGDLRRPPGTVGALVRRARCRSVAEDTTVGRAATGSDPW